MPWPQNRRQSYLVNQFSITKREQFNGLVEYLQCVKYLKKKQKILHTKAVTDPINSYIPNKVLNLKPPEISQKEESLSRNSRVVLTQLRSGYSRVLNSYLHRINEEIEDKCPDCNTSPHTTDHLFNCQMKPTSLTPTDLWTNPDLVASFLDLDETGVTQIQAQWKIFPAVWLFNQSREREGGERDKGERKRRGRREGKQEKKEEREGGEREGKQEKENGERKRERKDTIPFFNYHPIHLFLLSPLFMI